MIDFFGLGYEAAEAMGLLPRIQELSYDRQLQLRRGMLWISALPWVMRVIGTILIGKSGASLESLLAACAATTAASP
jgi:hypothetical protein